MMGSFENLDYPDSDIYGVTRRAELNGGVRFSISLTVGSAQEAKV